jgi:endonuclease YncB( thermonuclease family)
LLRAGLVCLAALAALSLPAMGADCPDLVTGPRGTITSVVDGDTVLLDNGLVVRLVGIQAPKLALDRPGFADWPLGAAAKAALAGFVLGHDVQLRYGGERRDRYGRTLAQLFLADSDDTWVQRAMLASGYARVYSLADNRQCLTPLFAAESAARANRLGIWAEPYYSLKQANRPQTLAESEGRYELVEGRVLLAEAAGRNIYLNFGRNWNVDFTAVIDQKAQSLFADSGIDPLMLNGALVRLRGWIEDRDGPRMAVTHPEQIEVLATQ